MSGRGGRGVGRGGRGGGRGGRKDQPLDYDPSVLVSDQPQENYPKTYKPPPASRFPLSGPEKRAIKHFIQLRRDFHNSPLYTHKHMTPDLSANSNITDPVPKSYGQEQRNARFGVRNKATVDPFLAVPMYSHQFVHEARIVPEMKECSFDESLFPEELWPTLAGHDGPSKSKGGAKKGTKRALDADDDDDVVASRRRRGPETEEERKRRIEEAAQGTCPAGKRARVRLGRGDARTQSATHRSRQFARRHRPECRW